MIKHYLLLIFLIVLSVSKAGSGSFPLEYENQNDIYHLLNLSGFGLPDNVFNLAFKGFSNLEATGRLQNSSILTIIDFSQSSKNKRMYVIDMQNMKLLYNTYVAHGLNTGEEFATSFSNELGTHKSSLGFYTTCNSTQKSNVGLSLILYGIEKGFNDNAQKREIIMHGADYATEDFIAKHGKLGRSFGCPSLPPDLIKPVSETIKGGTCLFIYYPDENYLHHSSLLNTDLKL